MVGLVFWLGKQGNTIATETLEKRINGDSGENVMKTIKHLKSYYNRVNQQNHGKNKF